MLQEVATDLPFIRRELITELIDNDVEILTNLEIAEITDNGITAIKQSRNVINVEGDKVVAMGLILQAEPYEELKSKAHEVYLIGDCVEARRVAEATHDGYRIGNIL